MTRLNASYGEGGRDYTWSATLAFATHPGDSSFRWREVSFWSLGRSDGNEPLGLAAGNGSFDIALSNIMGVMNVAFGPEAIDGEDEDQFQHRWLTLFSRAATGQLNRPSQMPPPKNFFG